MLCRLAEHRIYIAILPRLITTLTAFFIMIAHSVRKSKKMINSYDFKFEFNLMLGRSWYTTMLFKSPISVTELLKHEYHPLKPMNFGGWYSFLFGMQNLSKGQPRFGSKTGHLI